MRTIASSTEEAELVLYCSKLRRTSGQPLDALGNRRMGGEQAAEAHPQQWLDDEQMRRRWRGFHGHTARISVELGQSAGQRIRIARVDARR